MNLKHSRYIPLFLGILLICFSTAALAEDAPLAPDYSWGDKLGRGALNIISCPVEIARQIHLTSEEDSLLAGWTLGLLKGLGSAVVRLGAGAVDLVTFPFDWPKDGKAPLVQPEYVWQKPGVEYT